MGTGEWFQLGEYHGMEGDLGIADPLLVAALRPKLVDADGSGLCADLLSWLYCGNRGELQRDGG